jgi:hypothetical protein
MKNIFGSKYCLFSYSAVSHFLSFLPFCHFHPPLLLRLLPAIRFQRVLSVRNQDPHEKGLLHWLRNLKRTGVLLASQRIGIDSWVDMDDTSVFGKVHNLHKKHQAPRLKPHANI